jgi:DNA-binding transcriptional LysR family regulator
LKELTPFHSCWILNDFFLLVQVVDRGGFTAAGRTLRMPKSTLSHRIQQLEANLGVRLLNRTSRRFGVTDAGQEFYRHAVAMLREAEQAETAIRHRLSEPTGIVRCTAGVATMQFAMRGIMANFLVRYPKVNVVAHATDQYVDIVGENSDVAVRAHSDPLPDSTLVQRTLAPAPWFLFAGSAYLDADEAPQTPQDLQKRPSLFMMREGVPPVWRLRHSSKAKNEVVMPLTPRLLSDDMIGPETGGDRRPRNCRVARLRLPRRRSIARLAAGVAHLACGRFHIHRSHSLPAGPSPVGPRLCGLSGGGVAEGGPHGDGGRNPGSPVMNQKSKHSIAKS